MSNNNGFNFGQFIPGYDFLQQLSKTSQSTGAGLPPFANWVAPTVSVEEIDKRIDELKSVQFWLEQNSRGLTATIQALQVQKMTLSTLQDMNVNMGEFAKAFGFGAESGGSSSANPSSAATGSASNWPMDSTTSAAAPTAPAAEPAPSQAAPDNSDAQATESDPTPAMAAQAMQWWGALTQQFQQIATQVMQDPVHQAAMAQATNMASDFTKAAAQATSDMVRQAVSPVVAPKAKTSSKKATAAKPAAAAKAEAPSPAAQPAAKKAASKPAAKAPARKTAAKKASAAKK